ncbi:MAG: hypothetical protein WBA44_01755 [Mesorhizobium sp.]
MADSPQKATAGNATKPQDGPEHVRSPNYPQRLFRQPSCGQNTGIFDVANFIVTYDLNGPHPTHKQMDDHLLKLGASYVRGRILETVWYVAGPTTAGALREYVQRILSPNDLLLVVEATGAAWTKTLLDGPSFKATFERNQRRAAAA